MARRRCLFDSYFYVKYNGASYDGTLTIPSFDATGGTAQIEVISYKPWNLKSKPAWITMSTESGNRGKTLVTLTANTNSGSLRSGAIDIAPNTEKYKVSINVAQNSSSPTEYYFYFGNSGTATSTATTVESAVTTASFTYRTNYENLASSTTANWITSVTFSNGTLVVGFNANDTISDRTGTITIKGNGSNVATITITQKAIAYFNWGNTPGTTPTATTATSVSYQAGSVQTFYRTNYTGLTVTPESTYSWVDSYSLSNPDGNGTFKIDYQANGTTDVKTAVYDVKVGSAVIGKFTFNHQGTYTLSVTPTSSTVAATGGSIILFVTSNQAWSASSNQNWATLNTTAGTNNGQVTVTIPNYTVQSQRSVTITFTGQHGQTCTATITQQAAVTYAFAWDDNGETAITIDNISADGATGRSGYACTGYTAVRVGTTPENWLALSTNGGVNSYLYYTAGTNDTATARSDYNYIEGQKQDGTWERCGRIDHAQQAGTGPQDSISVEWTDGSSYDWTAPNTSGSKMITVAPSDSTLGWHLKESPSWVTINPTAGTGTNNNVTVSWDANTGAAKASDFITFCLNNDTNKDDFVKIGQEAGTTPPSHSLVIILDDSTIETGDTTSISIEYDGSPISITAVSLSYDTSIITIDNDGTVHGRADGSTTISGTYQGTQSEAVSIEVVDPYSPTRWQWYDVRIITGSTSAETAVTETISINGISQLIAIAYVRGLGKTVDVTTGSSYYYEGTETQASEVDSNGLFTPSSTGTSEIYSVYGSTSALSYVTINVTGSTPPPTTYYFYWSDNHDSAYTPTTIASDKTDPCYLYSTNYPSADLSVTTSSVGNWITDAQLTTGPEELLIQCTQNSTQSQRTGTIDVYLNHGGTSRLVGTLTLTQAAAQPPVKTLTAITFQINSAPTIPAGGGSVDCSDITDYVIMAYYSDNTSDDVTDDTAHQNIVDCSGVTASSRGTVTGNTMPAGILEMRMSYTEDGVTVDDYDSYVISQNANRLTETGITHSVEDERTIYGRRTDITYETTITPNGETVGATGTTTTFQVFAEKISTPYTITTTTWTNVDTPYSAYTSGEKANGRPVETPGSSTSETPGTPSSEEVEPVYLRTDNVVGGVFVSNVQKLPDVGSERNYWRATYPQNDTSSMRTNHIIFAATIDGEGQNYFALSQDGSSAPVITRTITVEPKDTFTLRAIGRPTTALSDSSFTLVGMGGTGSISYAASSYDTTDNVMTYTSQGSIVFNNVSTAATAVSVGFAEIDLNFNGYFNGLAGQSSFGSMGFDVSGGGTSIVVGGTYFVDIPVSAGSSDTTVYVVNLPPTPTANYTAS